MERAPERTICKTVATALLISLVLLTIDAPVAVRAKSYSFTATISPTEVGINQLATYSISITDTGTSTLGSASIAIPAGFTVLSPITILNPSSTWNYTLSITAISLTAISGGAAIQQGENVTFTFDAIAPGSSGVTVWTAEATTSINGGGGTLTLEGEQPTVTVISTYTAPTISASPDTINQNQFSLLSQSTGASGGTPPYTYQWLEAYNGGTFSPIAGANGLDYTFSTTTSTATGTWNFKLNVTDSSSVPTTMTSNTINVIVNPELIAPEVTATPNVISQTENSTLTSTTVTTGTPPYTYQWFQKAPGEDYTTVGDDSAGYTFPGTTTTGTWTFLLQVTDNTGASVNSSTVDVTVSSTPVFTITVIQTAHGAINPGTTSVILGGSQSFTISPDIGYQTADVSVNGISVGAVTSFVFANVTADHNLTATFTQIDYTLTISVVGNGSVTLIPSHASYHLGDVVQLTASPSAGWSFSAWSGDISGSVNPVSVTISGTTSVTATFIQNAYTLTVNIVGGGSVVKVPDQASYHLGDVVQLTAIPASGWRFSVWTGGLTGSLNPSSITINGNEAVTATFLANQYTITAIAGAGGSISPPETTIVDYGGSQAYNITPSAGYHIVDVLINSTSLGPVSSYTVSNVTGDTTITASFAPNTLTIEASAGPHGSINPNGTVQVTYDNDQSFTITPDTGYHIADVLVDGISVGALTAYTFTEVVANHNITANFATSAYYYFITVASSHGFPTPSAQVTAGDSFTVSVTSPEGDTSHRWVCTGYAIDGVAPVSGTSYTFINVQANHTITFNWQEQYHLTVISPFGSTTGTGWYNTGTTATASVSSKAITSDNGVLQIFTGWTGDAAGTNTTSNPMTVDSPKTATATWKTQYEVTYATSGNVLQVTAPPTEWVDGGAQATGTFPTSITNSAGNIRIIFVSDNRSAVITEPITVRGTYQTQYLVTFNQNGIASDAIGTVVTILGETKTYEQFPNSVWINAGGSITFSYVTTVKSAETNKQYILASTNFPSPLTIDEPTRIQGNYEPKINSSNFTLITIALVAILLSTPPSLAIPLLVRQRKRKKKITPIANEGGFISPSTVQTIGRGSDSTVFIITANSGYRIADVVIDNAVHLGAIRTYKFANVTESHTISATFCKE